MSNESLAFFTGLLGSLHCAAMCGPLVMSLPLSGTNWWFNLLQRLLYQSGRILTYSIFGLISGILGSGMNVLGLQQSLALISGFLLISIAVFHFSGIKTSRFNLIQAKMLSPIAKHIGQWLSKPYGGLFAGALHGLIPCGMVYMAVAASLNTASPTAGAEFMFFFGLGTTPLLLLASLAPLFLRKFKAPRLMLPVVFFIAGAFLIIRGLNVDVPFISMPVNTDPSALCR
jgi:sulfite exporter TauE/SafE